MHSLAFPRDVIIARFIKTELRPLHHEGDVAATTVFGFGLFARSNCTSGASVSTSAAVQAGVGIDRIDVAFLNCIGGTY